MSNINVNADVPIAPISSNRRAESQEPQEAQEQQTVNFVFLFFCLFILYFYPCTVYIVYKICESFILCWIIWFISLLYILHWTGINALFFPCFLYIFLRYIHMILYTLSEIFCVHTLILCFLYVWQRLHVFRF